MEFRRAFGKYTMREHFRKIRGEVMGEYNFLLLILVKTLRCVDVSLRIIISVDEHLYH
jgi:hypothetical protein